MDKKHTALVALASALILLLVLCLASASIRGELVARFDLARGRYEVLGYGYPVPWRPEYARLLRERYGIKFRAVAGCIVSESLSSYVHAYNALSEAASTRKFGHNVFKECADEASKGWNGSASRQERF
jgi:hypothetical protein